MELDLFRTSFERSAEAARAILTLLTSSEAPDAVFAQLAGHTARLLGADGAALYLLRPADHCLDLVAEHGVGAASAPISIPIGMGITGRAVAERRPLCIGDAAGWLAAHHDRWFLQGHPTVQHFVPRFQCACAAPVLIQGELQGALTAYFRRPHQASAITGELLDICAGYVALAIAQARLHKKAEQAVAAERARLARDLHDEVTQTLSAASLIADVLPQLWAHDPAEGAWRLQEVRRLTRGALAELRALLLALRPAALIEMPFAALLHQLADAIGGRAGVPITIAIEPADGELRLAPELQIALYHIAQEALHNAARHAQATRIALLCQLRQTKQRTVSGRATRRAITAVTLRVQDNGRGFDPQHVAPGHLGLHTMRERAQAVGARLKLTSVAGQGTTVTVTWKAGTARPSLESEVSDERQPPDPGDGRR